MIYHILRTQLTIDHIYHRLCFLAIVGPPITEFDPIPYVKKWLSIGRHAATDMGKTKTDKELVSVEPGKRAILKTNVKKCNYLNRLYNIYIYIYIYIYII